MMVLFFAFASWIAPLPADFKTVLFTTVAFIAPLSNIPGPEEFIIVLNSTKDSFEPAEISIEFEEAFLMKFDFINTFFVLEVWTPEVAPYSIVLLIVVKFPPPVVAAIPTPAESIIVLFTIVILYELVAMFIEGPLLLIMVLYSTKVKFESCSKAMPVLPVLSRRFLVIVLSVEPP